MRSDSNIGGPDIDKTPPIDVVLCIDRYYFPQLAVTLRSLFENNTRHRFRVSIFTDRVYPELEDRLLSSVREFDHAVAFHVLDLDRIHQLTTQFHLSHATYFRLAIPHVLPADVNRVLYLDSDILVQGDIGPLWETDLAGVVHAAIEDGQFDAHEKLQIPKDAPYFNAGVMVIDLAAWRRERIVEKAFDLLEREFHRVTWLDQCALNAVSCHRWRPVARTFNAQRLHFFEPIPTGSGLRFKPRPEADLDVAIAHFTGDEKPWDAGSDHPLRDRWFSVLDSTAWVGHRPFAASLAWDELAAMGRVWLFGAGGLGRKVKDRLDRVAGVEIAGIIDNFKTGAFDGLPISRMADLSPAALANDAIVISSQFWQRIRLELLDLGAKRLFIAHPYDDQVLRQIAPNSDVRPRVL